MDNAGQRLDSERFRTLTLKKKLSLKPCSLAIDISIPQKCKCYPSHPYPTTLTYASLRYGTERQTGIAMKKSGVPREETFLATKLWCNSHHPDDVETCLDGSLARLGTDYVDVLMIHYPVALARYVKSTVNRDIN